MKPKFDSHYFENGTERGGGGAGYSNTEYFNANQVRAYLDKLFASAKKVYSSGSINQKNNAWLHGPQFKDQDFELQGLLICVEKFERCIHEPIPAEELATRFKYAETNTHRYQLVPCKRCGARLNSKWEVAD